jgi:hypothetical protein
VEAVFLQNEEDRLLYFFVRNLVCSPLSLVYPARYALSKFDMILDKRVFPQVATAGPEAQVTLLSVPSGAAIASAAAAAAAAAPMRGGENGSGGDAATTPAAAAAVGRG